MRFLSFFLPLILISCSQGQVRRDVLETAYRTSGLEQFFLPELPSWANTSPSGQCFKKHSYQYMDFKKLAESYQLTYPELIELQAQYNDRLESYFRSTAMRFVKPMEEAAFFSNTLESVKGGVRTFKLPAQAKKVDIIWLDRFIALNQVYEIKKMNEMGRFDERVPVLFSSCLSRQDLNQWLVENKLDTVGFFSLSAEWLSPFGPDMSLKTGLHLEIKKLIGLEVDVRFVSPGEILLPSEIIL
jgi:hypothetical protein